MNLRPAADWREDILALQRAGDHLQEYDLVQLALAQYPDEEFFRHALVLALARCNAKQKALEQFYQLRLHESKDPFVRALEPRLLKDLAFQSLDAKEPFAHHDSSLFAAAAETYEREFERAGGHYAAVNAATLWCLAGEWAKVHPLAERALELAQEDTGPPLFPLITKSEALILLGRSEEAYHTLLEAARHNHKNLQTRARAYRQLQLLCQYLGLSTALLAPLLPETVVHYCGHVFFNHRPLTPAEEQNLRHGITAALQRHHVAIAYGSLMAGSDILFAEALLAHGAELNVWLPFGEEDFCAINVRPAGGDWEARYWKCLNAAHSVSFVTESDFLGDESLFALCSRVAMGMTRMRAASLHVQALQLAVWDESLRSRGTFMNLQTWQQLGAHTEIIPAPPVGPRTTPSQRRQDYPPERRVPKAILFADVRGFSQLNDREILWFYQSLYPRLAAVIDPHREALDHINTWGDALYLVADSACLLARIALDLIAAFKSGEQAAGKDPLQLRVGLHYGPVYRTWDGLARQYTYASHDVTKTARIEPVTPPGEVFATEPFVATLMLDGEDDFIPEYAGNISSAKNFGAFRMFHLRRHSHNTAPYCAL